MDPSGHGTESPADKDGSGKKDHSGDIEALKELVDEVNEKGGATPEEAAILKEWADKYGVDYDSLGVKEKENGGSSGGSAEAVDSNKLNHILGKKQHNLDGFLNSFNGNQTEAYKALLKATEEYIKANNITGTFKDKVISVNGFNITVRGAVVDGNVKIGTAFIP